jgi:plasmid replication initiation protein
MQQEELGFINTPETLGATPSYVLQHNAISRSAHGLSATASKLAAMAMSLLPTDLSSLTAAFTFQDFCNALGMPTGGETYKIFKAAVQECMQCLIYLETEPDEKGKKAWKAFTWFNVSTFDEKTGQATMEFSDKLAGFLIALKWMYSKKSLKDIGELQSRYAIRLFEIAMSYKSMQGKGGNSSQKWYFERPIPELKKIMGVKEGTHKETRSFRQKAIEAPLKEINKAGLGIEIKTEGIKQGRRLASIRFDCAKVPRTIRRKGKEEIPLPEPDYNADRLLEEKELERLRELYPDKYAELYEEKMAAGLSWLPEEIRKTAAEGYALMQLKELYGIKK